MSLLFASPAWAARVINSVTVNGASSVSVSPGATVTLSLSVTTSGNGVNDDWKSTSYTLNGVTTCVDSTDFGEDGTYSDSFDITAPAAGGNYDLLVYAHRIAGCNPLNDSNLFTLSDAIQVESGFDHFIIDVSGADSTCAPTAITIRAVDAGNSLVSDYSESVTISTSSGNGNWSINAGNGALTPNPDNDDNGSASYRFVPADGGTVVLSLQNTHAEALTISVTDGNALNSSAPLTFGDNAFVITPVDSLADDVIAGRNHALLAQMVRRDPVSGDCGVATEYNVGSIKAWYNPHANDPGITAPSLMTASATRVLPDAEPGANNLTLPFVNGEALFSLATSDVGRYSISFKDDGFSFSDEDIATQIPGDSPVYTVRPFGFALDVTGNPAASDGDGAVFIAAGSSFAVITTAVGWQLADDINNDGIADGHNDTDPDNDSDLADNFVLPGFGLEGSPESITLSSALLVPAGGTDPGLGGNNVITAFAGGSASTAVSFAEVGIIDITAAISSGNYLGAGVTRSNKAISHSGYVGRFIPAYFSLDSGDVAPACSSGNFSYLGQPFSASFSLGARNAGGDITRNYHGDFAKLGIGELSYSAIDRFTSTVLGGRLAGSSETVNWIEGSGAIDIALTLARIDGLNTQDGPFSQTAIGVLPLDDDSVSFRSADLDLDGDNDSTLDSINLGNTELRYGRLSLQSTHGPESTDLPVNFQLEYWNGSTFVISGNDDCSEISLASITYPDGPLSSGDFGVDVGAGTSTGNYALLTATDIGFTAGDAGHYFSAPGIGNTGSFAVDVDLSVYPWLQYDWNSDGSFLDNTTLPTATFSFGSYRGHDRVIFWHEILN